MSFESLELDSLNQAAPVGPQLARILRDAIIRNLIKPATRVSETEVAARFGVSRQPVREAFIKLAEEGLLEVRPQRGTFVRKISLQAVMDARFVREAVEADVVRACALNAPAHLVTELRSQLRAQKKLADDQPAAFMPLDDEFHRTLAEGAGCTNAWTVIDGMKSQMDRVRQMTSTKFPLKHLIQQHTEVVDAIETGEPDRAETAIRAHLRMILQDLPAIRGDYPEYFDTADI